MSNYAWICTKDHVSGTDDPKVTDFETIEVIGPRDASDAQIAALRRGEGHAFRMYDDDGFINLSGQLLGDGESEQGFAPLDDYGTASYGCTYIQYQHNGRWETL